MSGLTQWQYEVASREFSSSSRIARIFTSPQGVGASVLGRNPAVVLSISSALVAAHLFIVILKPSWADGVLYPIIGLAVLLCAAIFYLQGSSTAGAPALRWYLFALALGLSCLDCVRAAVGVFFSGYPLHNIDAVLKAAIGTLVILALTMPSLSRSRAELALDISVALFFCALRIIYLNGLISPNTIPFTFLTRITFESALGALLCFIAMIASSRADLVFFKSAVIYLGASLIACVCTNQIGFLWLNQQTASPWSLTATALRIGAALFLLHGLAAPAPVQVSLSQKAVLRSMVPFVMSCLVVWLSAALLRMHPALGAVGISVGIGGFLARTGLAARQRHSHESIETLVGNPTNATGLDPLNGVENRAAFQRALARARPAVTSENPLALILFGVEEELESSGRFIFEHEDDHLISIARILGQWNIASSSLCYMGNARFAMVLPSTGHRIAKALAEQICISVEALQRNAKGGTITVSVGVASTTKPTEVDSLLGDATNALVHAHIGRGGRRRLAPFDGGPPFEC